MTTDATLHQDIRKMMQLIEALLTHGSGTTSDPVRQMIDDLSAIRDSLDECAMMMKKAVDRLEDYK